MFLAPFCTRAPQEVAGPAQVCVVVPLVALLQGRRHSPAMSETELGENRARCMQAEVMHEIVTEEPHGHGVDEDDPLPGETEEAPGGIQLEKLLLMEFFNTHRIPRSE